MRAEGVNAQGQTVAERPLAFIPDGKEYPVPGFSGLKTVATRESANAVQVEVHRQDGSIIGQGKYVVSGDGRSLTATTSGFDAQLRRFETRTNWDRFQSPS